jgi:peptide chain release factor 2
MLFSEAKDRSACFLSVHAGAGGTEAQDWALMLLRMYTRWAEHAGYAVELVDESSGEEAGIKSATLRIGESGAAQFPFGWLKGESGVHRLVRISPFDSASRRHTSFASVLITPEIGQDIDIDIRENDLKIDTYRASGAGGQHVNKTDSAVRITHLPSGIIVQCQSDRSQHRNKAVAMSMLKSRLYEKEQAKRKEEMESGQDKQGISWGHQIRSYVLQPYQMVKDLRTGMESSNPAAVLEGDIALFLEAFLTQQVSGDVKTP